MSLTFGAGPLSREPASTNYEIDGPAHRIYFHPFGRRVRLELAGEVVLDTLDAHLLHETGILPRLYVPVADIRTGVLEPSETTSHCPFKGDATYRTVRGGDAVAGWPGSRASTRTVSTACSTRTTRWWAATCATRSTGSTCAAPRGTCG